MDRIHPVQQFLAERQIDGALLCQPENRRYFSGFTGSTGYVLLTQHGAWFFTDFRYTEQAKRQCTGFTIADITPTCSLFDHLKRMSLRTLAVEEDFISLAFSRRLQQECSLQLGSDIAPAIRAQRWIKNAAEQDCIRRACEITDQAFDHILTVIRPGITEAEINLELQHFMLRQPGVERTADRFIVASGPRGSMPHGIATDRAVQSGELVTMDFGCCYQGYWSDLTRTVCVGKASNAQKEIYACVLEAQRRAIAAVRPGITGRSVDQVARDYIASQGHKEHFGHGLGHSFGLEIHEPPRFAPNEEGDIPLVPGMIMTVEPGVYIEGFGGVRIEDDIVITADGCQLLSNCRRDLVEL